MSLVGGVQGAIPCPDFYCLFVQRQDGRLLTGEFRFESWRGIQWRIVQQDRMDPCEGSDIGSSPVLPTMRSWRSQIARFTVTEEVAGLSPAGRAKVIA